MLKRANIVRGAGMRVLDLLALALALPVAYQAYLLFPFGERLAPLSRYGAPLALVLLLWAACAWVAQVYDAPSTRGSADDLRRLSRALGCVAVGVLAAAFFAKADPPSRLLYVLYFAAAFALLASNRAALRLVGWALHRSGYRLRRFAVVGSGGLAREVVESIAAHPEWGLQFAGFVLLDGVEHRSRGPVLGALSQLGRILEQEVLDQVIFAVPRDRMGAIELAAPLCEEQGVDVQITLDLLRFGDGRMSVGQLDGIPLLSFTKVPTDAISLALKRVFDLLVSGAVLVGLAPLVAVVAAAIKLDSKGPVHFRQTRVGLNGRTFSMLKFRSMYVDAEARLEALRAQNEMTGPVFKMTNDPRITRVGRLLRRTSLDELPQFWNVLLGQMSVVGPRPPIPAEVRQYKRWQRRRLSVKPGITCLWQISGRNEIGFDRWMELDLEYIDRWSLAGDIAICLKTIPAVLSARGAR